MFERRCPPPILAFCGVLVFLLGGMLSEPPGAAESTPFADKQSVAKGGALAAPSDGAPQHMRGMKTALHADAKGMPERQSAP